MSGPSGVRNYDLYYLAGLAFICCMIDRISAFLLPCLSFCFHIWYFLTRRCCLRVYSDQVSLRADAKYRGRLFWLVQIIVEVN